MDQAMPIYCPADYVAKVLCLKAITVLLELDTFHGRMAPNSTLGHHQSSENPP